jgi:hypothetical protein
VVSDKLIEAKKGTQIIMIVMVGHDFFLLCRRVGMIFYDSLLRRGKKNLRFENCSKQALQIKGLLATVGIWNFIIGI